VSVSQFRSIIEEENADSLLSRVLSDLNLHGELVSPVVDRLSVASRFGKRFRRTKEIIGYQFVLANPRARVVYNKGRDFNLIFAFAQFLWNLSASNEIEPILTYNRRASEFSDDGRTIHGSAYWSRLLGEGNGQLQNVLNNLRNDPSSRRTFATIFRPEDNSGITRDVPCPIGVQYFVRDEKLQAVTYMRSNSAALMMPYNIFFFTMIQELIARELGLEPGKYVHFCGSLHYYEDEQLLVNRVIQADGFERFAMRPMPRDTTLKQVGDVVDFQKKLGAGAAHSQRFEFWKNEAEKFDPYWTQVCYLLIWHKLVEHGLLAEAGLISTLLGDEYRPFAQKIPSNQTNESSYAFEAISTH